MGIPMGVGKKIKYSKEKFRLAFSNGIKIE